MAYNQKTESFFHKIIIIQIAYAFQKCLENITKTSLTQDASERF